MDPEAQFINGLLELQYGLDVQDKLTTIAHNVDWARGWPSNTISFWNAEAFMWSHKIEKKTRQLITNELSSLQGTNLDLGCGAYCYIPSTGFDISPKMLDFNDNLKEKVVGDVEKPLAFVDNEFDSVTAIFLLNYVTHYAQLLSEIKRIVKGTFIMVLSATKVNEWQRQKEKNHYDKEKWVSILENNFSVTVKEKDDLWFFTCTKQS